MNLEMSPETRPFQRRNAIIFAAVFLAFLGPIRYNSLMLKRFEIALDSVVKNSGFERPNPSRPAQPPQAFSSIARHAIRLCERVVQVAKEHPSGFGVALRRADCAALLWQPGTHPRRMRSAVF